MSIDLSIDLSTDVSEQLIDAARRWAGAQYELVVLSAHFADSGQWALDGATTAAHWLAGVADIEVSTAREWIRVGRVLRGLDASADAFEAGELSYSKIRTLTRVATPENEAELLDLARRVPAGELGRAIAAWLGRNADPDDLEAHQQRQRAVTWRTEPDGMTVFTLRLPPLVAGLLIAFLTTWVMTTRSRLSAPLDAWPTLAQQHADAIGSMLTDGAGDIDTEVVLHVRGDGCTLDDGTPIPASVVERIAPQASLRALIHDAERHPVQASHRRRHPTTRQKRVVKERDRACVDCGGRQLLEYDHEPAFELTRHTMVDELRLRCAPCHQRRHA